MFLERMLSSKFFSSFHDKFIQLLHYDRIFCDSDCDLVWDPSGSSCFCNFRSVPRISTIHDLIHFDIPLEDKKLERLKDIICMKNSIHFSKKIITVSEFSQKRICDKFHVSKDFVKHIPIKLGTRIYSDANAKRSSVILNKYKLKPQKYFIFCSTWWKNKNHLALMKAFNKFAEKNPEIKLILVTPIMD